LIFGNGFPSTWSKKYIKIYLLGCGLYHTLITFCCQKSCSWKNEKTTFKSAHVKFWIFLAWIKTWGANIQFFFFFLSIFARISIEYFHDDWAYPEPMSCCEVSGIFFYKLSLWSYKIRSLTVFRNSNHFQNLKFFLIILMYLSCISRENVLLVE